MTHKRKNMDRVYFANGKYIDLPRKQVKDIFRSENAKTKTERGGK